MSDLISRRVAIVQLSHNKKGDDDCDVVIQNDIETIKALPSEEVSADIIHLQKEQAYMQGYEDGRKSRKGKWRYYESILTCSECGAEFYDDIKEYCGDDVPKFCPECGADMREGGEE